MRLNLRMVAAERGVWRSTDLRRALADAGLEMSAGKMSNLWSGTPITIRLDDLDVICAVLDCSPGDLFVAEPAAAPVDVSVPKSPRSSDVRPARRQRNERSVPPA